MGRNKKPQALHNARDSKNFQVFIDVEKGSVMSILGSFPDVLWR